jgi:hypothetical protein
MSFEVCKGVADGPFLPCFRAFLFSYKIPKKKELIELETA